MTSSLRSRSGPATAGSRTSTVSSRTSAAIRELPPGSAGCAPQPSPKSWYASVFQQYRRLPPRRPRPPGQGRGRPPRRTSGWPRRDRVADGPLRAERVSRVVSRRTVAARGWASGTPAGMRAEDRTARIRSIDERPARLFPPGPGDVENSAGGCGVRRERVAASPSDLACGAARRWFAWQPVEKVTRRSSGDAPFSQWGQFL